VLSCLAVALVFIAAAQPQYGKGTRILPATNLDVVLVLDYSKSMYARDVSPSRIGRAKIEMGRLVRELSGARFAAVAFAGESISFPLTSDGSAIAQFFRGMEPNDLPVGGTAIARALESGRQLLERDPLSKNHERVMILVTDGEDLEGDPVGVAQATAADGIRVDVVQIGGDSPEPIPNIDDDGMVQGMRKDSSGQIMTTQLTEEGRAQLASIAREGGGKLVRAAQGEVGLEEMTRSLRTLMSEELSERVETVFADVYHYPLAFAVLLLMIEAWIGSARRHDDKVLPPKGASRRRRTRRLQGIVATLALACLGCEPVDQLFVRESPVVRDAIAALKAKDPTKASELLIEYLETGACEAGVIGAGDRARSRPDAAYDLSLAFSALATSEQSKAPAAPGTTPGVPGAPGPLPQEPSLSPEASSSIDCALRVLAPLSQDDGLPADLRARVHYLAGNLEMLRAGYEAAVVAYDQALLFAPGVAEEQAKKPPWSELSIDPLGLHIAYNRALALRLQKEQEEQQQQQEEQENTNQDEQQDQDQDQDQSEESEDQDGDSGESEDQQKGEQDEKSEQQDESGEDEQDPSGQPDEKEEEPRDPSSSQSDPSSQEQDAPQDGQQTPQQVSQPSEARDERMLDLLEQAPTLQQHDAEKRKNEGVVIRSTMEDK
jgi:Ca-activated chloride channel family protein